MKKIIYILPVLIISVLFTNTSFAYNYYTDNGTTYSNEQFRRDVKSYLDDQTTRQQNQDLLNTINTGYSNVKTQFEIDQMQKELDKAKANNTSLDNQIKQVQELINQQNQIMIEQKKLNDEKEVYANTNVFCKSLDIKYRAEGVTQDLKDNCAKYGVTMTTSVELHNAKLERPDILKTNTVKRPAFLDEKPENENINLVKKYNLLDLDTATTTSTTTMQAEMPIKKSFLRKTFEKMKSFFVWW